MLHSFSAWPIKPLAIAIASLTSGATISSALAAQTVQEPTVNQQPVMRFSEVIVAADRNPATAEKNADIVLISQLQLEQQQPESIAQALKYTPNLTVVGGPRASNQAPNIRGLSAARVLQTIDGARQNFNSGHRGSYPLTPELLKQIEVKKGPSSSLWGSGALGGVVAQTTKSAQDLLHDGNNMGAYLKQEFANNNDARQTSVAIFGSRYTSKKDNNEKSGDVDFLINSSSSDSDDLELGNGQRLDNSADEHSAWLAKTGWNLTQNQRLELSLRHSNRDQLTPSNPNTNAGSSVPLIERNTIDQNITANYWLQALAGKHTTQLTLYQNQTQFDEFRRSLNQHDTTRVDTRGLAITNTSEGLGSQWVYGLDVYRDQINTLRDGDQRPANLEGELATLGVFAQLTIPLSEKLSLSSGLRYDRFQSENKQRADSKRDDSAISPSVRAAYQATPWLNLSIGYAKAFRAPGAEELYTEGTHFCYGDFSFMGLGTLCNTFIANPDLQMEEAANTEVRADAQFFDLWNSGDQFTVNAAVFHNKVNHFIEQQVINPHFILGLPMNTTYRNVDQAQIQGFELTGRYLLNDLELGLNYGQSRGIDLNNDTHLSNIPADKWVLDIGHYFFQRDLKLGLRTTQVSTQAKIAQGYADQYDGYTLTDIYATWEAATGNLSGLKLGLSVDNLSDEYYRVAYQELYMPGRNIKLFASYNF